MTVSIDRNSSTSMAARGLLEGFIETKRRSIENPTHGWDKTQVMRGELKAYRRVFKEFTLTPDEEVTDDE